MGVQVSRICTIFYGESVLEIFASFDLDKNVPPTHGRLNARGGGRFQHGPGRLARPDRNRRPFMKNEQCAACRRVGHVAKHCDMLAKAICLEKYTKKDLSPSLRDQIEKEWID
jgi:hypothetical protein